jgi:signal transduction histidine kinase
MERLMNKGSVESIQPEKIRKLIKTNKQQSERLTRLVDDMLDLTRISSGKLDIRREPIDLQQIIKHIVDRYQTSSAQSQLPIDVEIDPSIRGYWDRIRFEQVVDNLVSNALKYGSGKPIKIQGLRRGDRVILTVQDYGIGIPEEAQERIFNRFERAVPVTNISGFGLGLYIAKRIVAAHGGKIRVRSEPGKGATFIVELPLGQEPFRTAHA